MGGLKHWHGRSLYLLQWRRRINRGGKHSSGSMALGHQTDEAQDFKRLDQVQNTFALSGDT
jgi:hypothetical protein